MKKRNIFFAISLACLAVFVLFCAYLLKGDNVYSKETESVQNTPAKQNVKQDVKQEEQQKKASSAGPVPAVTSPATPAVQYMDNPQQAVNQSIPPAEDNNTSAENNCFVPGCEVGDIVKLGDVELLVTRATSKYKVIEITIKGNELEQKPKLVLQEPNRIIYEIPADVDINVDVTEKVQVNKSSLLDEGKKAGK